MSSKDKQIKDKELNGVSGGSGLVTTIDCPSCGKHAFKITQGNTTGHCVECGHSESIKLFF